MCCPFVRKAERKKVARDIAVVAGEDCNPIVGSVFLAGTGLEPFAGGIIPLISGANAR
jgi:hypothetical protein